MGFTNILVLSDNMYLCKEVQKILYSKLFSIQDVSFAISPYSDIKQFSTEFENELLTYDLSIKEDVDEIINKYDLVFSIHCKQLFPKELVNQEKCINIHPGYNPINRGWYPQVFAINNQLPIGATIHEIDEKLDHGPIIAQEFVEYDYSDTSLTLYEKILEKELELFNHHIDSILGNNYKTEYPIEEGNLFLKKDFNSLCELQLDEKATYGELINLLRALSHGQFKNAYFFDPKTNEKIYISVELQKNN